MKEHIFFRLSRVLGLSDRVGWRGWKPKSITAKLKTKAELADVTGRLSESPVHTALLAHEVDLANAIVKPVTLPFVSDIEITAEAFIDGVAVIALPNARGCERMSEIYASLLARTLRDAGHEVKAVEVVGCADKCKQFLYYPAELIADEDCERIKEAIVTSVLTNDETDLDIELELNALRSRSYVNRRRIQERMEALGIKVLRGKKADIYLRRKSKGAKIDAEKLRTNYPEAFAACLIAPSSSTYISVKLHEQ